MASPQTLGSPALQYEASALISFLKKNNPHNPEAGGFL
jgi:hypothetical protein